MNSAHSGTSVPASSDAVLNNVAVFQSIREQLGSTKQSSYTGAVDKFRPWLKSHRAYYEQARPVIIDILETAQASLRREAGVEDEGSPFDISRCPSSCVGWKDAYEKLVRTVVPFASLFEEEPDLHARLRGLVASIGRTLELPALPSPSHSTSRRSKTRSVQLSGSTLVSSPAAPVATTSTMRPASRSSKNTPPLRTSPPTAGSQPNVAIVPLPTKYDQRSRPTQTPAQLPHNPPQVVASSIAYQAQSPPSLRSPVTAVMPTIDSGPSNPSARVSATAQPHVEKKNEPGGGTVTLSRVHHAQPSPTIAVASPHTVDLPPFAAKPSPMPLPSSSPRSSSPVTLFRPERNASPQSPTPQQPVSTFSTTAASPISTSGPSNPPPAPTSAPDGSKRKTKKRHKGSNANPPYADFMLADLQWFKQKQASSSAVASPPKAVEVPPVTIEAAVPTSGTKAKMNELEVDPTAAIAPMPKALPTLNPPSAQTAPVALPQNVQAENEVEHPVSALISVSPPAVAPQDCSSEVGTSVSQPRATLEAVPAQVHQSAAIGVSESQTEAPVVEEIVPVPYRSEGIPIDDDMKIVATIIPSDTQDVRVQEAPETRLALPPEASMRLPETRTSRDEGSALNDAEALAMQVELRKTEDATVISLEPFPLSATIEPSHETVDSIEAGSMTQDPAHAESPANTSMALDVDNFRGMIATTNSSSAAMSTSLSSMVPEMLEKAVFKSADLLRKYVRSNNATSTSIPTRSADPLVSVAGHPMAADVGPSSVNPSTLEQAEESPSSPQPLQGGIVTLTHDTEAVSSLDSPQMLHIAISRQSQSPVEGALTSSPPPATTAVSLEGDIEKLRYGEPPQHDQDVLSPVEVTAKLPTPMPILETEQTFQTLDISISPIPSDLGSVTKATSEMDGVIHIAESPCVEQASSHFGTDGGVNGYHISDSISRKRLRSPSPVPDEDRRVATRRRLYNDDDNPVSSDTTSAAAFPQSDPNSATVSSAAIAGVFVVDVDPPPVADAQSADVSEATSVDNRTAVLLPNNSPSQAIISLDPGSPDALPIEPEPLLDVSQVPGQVSPFSEDAKVLALERGSSSISMMVIHFQVEESQGDLLALWKQRELSEEDVSNGLCISLACYSFADSLAVLRANPNAHCLELASRLRPSWPDKGGLWGQMASGDLLKPSFSLSPPISTTDGLLDITAQVTVGSQKLEIIQQRDASEMVFVVYAHKPTLAQLGKLGDFRQRTKEWELFLQEASIAPTVPTLDDWLSSS